VPFSRIFSADDQPREYPTELNSTAGVKFLTALQTNLGSPEKALRLATIRILSHFEPLSNGALESAQSHPKRQKHSDGRPHVKGLENPSQVKFSCVYMSELLALYSFNCHILGTWS
jgi:hypothetical protein